LAIRLLEKRGHSVFATKNGREALEVLEKRAFDLALFDVQMPEIDGLEVTRTIRSKEKSTGSHLPIIAVTAHVMKGDRENCVEAGADDYIGKPIQPMELYAAIERFRGAPKASEFPGPKFLAASSNAVLNPEEMLRHVQGDRDLLAGMVRLLSAGTPSLLQELREAVGKGDALAISRVSHNLKGALSNFGSGPAYQAALNMETLAHGGDAKAAGAAVPVLESEIERLQTALEPFCNSVVK